MDKCQMDALIEKFVNLNLNEYGTATVPEVGLY